MKSETYLVLLIVAVSIIVGNNLLMIRENPFHSIIDVVLCGLIAIFALLYRHTAESWKSPNPYVCGKNIAGTVYAAYPEKAPGLGWI